MAELNEIINTELHEPDILRVTEYYDIDELNNFLLESRSNITILSLNIQSLNSKYDLFLHTLEELNEANLRFSVICLQEAQIKPNTNIDHLTLDHLDYNMVFKGLSLPNAALRGVL